MTRFGTTALLRTLVVLGLVLTIGWASASNVVANISADNNPDLALRFVPDHPVALAEKAGRQFRSGEVDGAKGLARKAIRETAVASEAVQVLGLIEGATSSADKADRLFSYTLSLNQREVPAQTWLFQRRLMGGNIASALRHVDAAMRVSVRTRGALYPLLAAAIASDGLHGPVTAMFSRNPVWLADFVRYSISSDASLAPLARALVELPEDSPARTVELQAKLLQRLAEAGEHSAAQDFMSEIVASPGEALLRDSSFSINGPYAPFDWQYVNEAGLGAVPTPGSEAGLKYFAATGQGGRVARQLITLAPGTYRLAAMGRKLSPDRDGGPTWTITCADGDSPQTVAKLPMQKAASDKSTRIVTRFIIPSKACLAQSLDLNLQATFDPGGLRGVIYNVTITPVVSHGAAPAAKMD